MNKSHFCVNSFLNHSLLHDWRKKETKNFKGNYASAHWLKQTFLNYNKFDKKIRLMLLNMIKTIIIIYL